MRSPPVPGTPLPSHSGAYQARMIRITFSSPGPMLKSTVKRRAAIVMLGGGGQSVLPPYPKLHHQRPERRRCAPRLRPSSPERSSCPTPCPPPTRPAIPVGAGRREIWGGGITGFLGRLGQPIERVARVMIGKTRKAEDHAPFRPGCSLIAQMDFKNRARSIGRLRIAGNERRPTPHADLHRRVGFIFNVGDGIVAPILALLHSAAHADAK